MKNGKKSRCDAVFPDGDEAAKSQREGDGNEAAVFLFKGKEKPRRRGGKIVARRQRQPQLFFLRRGGRSGEVDDLFFNAIKHRWDYGEYGGQACQTFLRRVKVLARINLR